MILTWARRRIRDRRAREKAQESRTDDPDGIPWIRCEDSQGVTGELAAIDALPQATVESLLHRLRRGVEGPRHLGEQPGVVVKREHVSEVEDEGVERHESF